MDVKKKIKNEVDVLVVSVAGAYNELITGDIPDSDIERTVESVSKAKDYAETNLISIAEKVVEETIVAVHEEAEAKDKRLLSLLPTNIETSRPSSEPPVFVPPKEVSADSAAPPAPMVLEGPAVPLPRDISGPADDFTPPNVASLMEQAEQALQNTRMGGGVGLVDMDPNVEVAHDLTTAANESRVAQGLPPKGKGPTIHVTGQQNVAAPKAVPVVSSPAAPPGYEKDLRMIGRLVSKYVDSSNAEVQMLALNVLSLVEGALNEDFTKTQKEASSAE